MTVNLVAAGREAAEMATVIVMARVIFDSQPARTVKRIPRSRSSRTSCRGE
jgi:hypothetical protein